MANQSRGLFVALFNNFINSFKFRKTVLKSATQIKGEDPFGNKYYEIPADPSRGKRRPVRWYTALNTPEKSSISSTFTDGFDSELPAEWESWLRNRRDHPPSAEEVIRSLQMGEMKKMNAAKLEEQRIEQLKAEGIYIGGEEPVPQDHEKPSYPKRNEYELIPGENLP
ncbi:NDUFAF2 [Lepeophtheirus salmonis]|uniref:NDUFAF2 n=1 Tax=Lepeophtheirus salmonis TaxID=72036 RepID=A0A7R8D4U7_LEPSM|nr:NDUFAF2 [Lepeophtheirus salmonis]CAF2975252.1 NDUFAF2 [Lepeophtheirus salmonis]